MGFCLKVEFIVWIGRNYQRHGFNYFDPIPFNSRSFDRVVGDKFDLPQTHFPHDTGANTIIAFILLESQLFIGLICVPTVILELVGLDLVEKSDAASLLVQIYDHTFALFFHNLHGFVELLATVASH